MIPPHAVCTIRRIPLALIRVTMHERRDAAKVLRFVALLDAHPGYDHSFLVVAPDRRHPGLYVLQDGHHRFCAHIICGRHDVLCNVVDEGEEIRELPALLPRAGYAPP